jgi:molecular chaperone GrpE
MSEIDPRTGEQHAAEAPSPSPARPGEGAPAPHQAPAVTAEDAAPVASAEGGADGNGAAELEGDLDELVRVAAQRDEYLALAQRTQADFENYRKRVARDAAAAKERGVSALAKELLPALDNLDRAMSSAQEDDPLLEGVRLVRAELSAALLRAGIESFSPLGEVFDPSLHEAVATAPGPGGTGSGTVIEVYQDGYRLGASVLRPARVVVGA